MFNIEPTEPDEEDYTVIAKKYDMTIEEFDNLSSTDKTDLIESYKIDCIPDRYSM